MMLAEALDPHPHPAKSAQVVNCSEIPLGPLDDLGLLLHGFY
jgi:hypothetical protein